MGFKVKDTPERDNFEVIEAENELRLDILNQLSVLDIKILQIAYLYAKNYVEYGVDVTEKWVTACQNSKDLEKAHYDGYCKGYEKAKQDYCDKWRIKHFFGDRKVILDPEKHNFGLDDSDSKAWTTSPKFRVGDWIYSHSAIKPGAVCLVTDVLKDRSYEVITHGFIFGIHEDDMQLLEKTEKDGEGSITVDDLGFKICTDEKKEPKFKVGDKILISDAWSFDDDKVECIVTEVLDNDHYKVTSYGSELEVYEHEMELVKEENPQNPIYKFEIGQIVGKFERYPNHSKFKILDRFVINLTHPYYKIGLIDRFFNEDSQEIVPNHYQYVPESELYLKGDDTNSRSFKFNVGDIVRTKNANRGLYKISARYCHNVKHNTYKIGQITDGYGCCTIVDEDRLELVSKR